MVKGDRLLDLSIIIVNRNTRDLVLTCIESIYETVPQLSFEIFLVDNASDDGSVAAVLDRFPAVHAIGNDRNLGFARANNQAIRKATGRFVVLLNTDTVLTSSALALIVEYMDSNPDVTICGGQLLNRDGSLQNSIANLPTLATELLNKSLLRRLNPRRYPGKEHRFDQPVEVESIIGACMVVRREAIEGAGLLDETYFFFFEETDWCLAMKKKGGRVFFHPEARIYHLQGETAKKNLVAARIEYWKSRYTYFRKHYSASTFILLRSGLFAKLCCSVVLQLAGSLASSSARARLRVNAAILFWHLLGCPAGWGLADQSVQEAKS